MQFRSLLIVLALLIISTQISAQQLGRTLGARAFQCDDGTGSGFTMTWDIGGYLDQSYTLHWPSDMPTIPLSYCAVDASGNMTWVQPTMLSLSPGNIWYGNTLSVATPLAPGLPGAFLGINDLGMPEWMTGTPSLTTFPADLITSGTLPTGDTITVGRGAIITVNGGSLTANELSGAGSGKYSGVVAIPPDASSLDILYSGITDASVVMVSINDPNANDFTVIANVLSINPGVGFTVTFTAPYPNPAGSLHYVVINP